MRCIKEVKYTDSLFCKDCKGMLVPKDIDGKMILYCRKCDQPYKMKNNQRFVFKTEMKDSVL